MGLYQKIYDSICVRGKHKLCEWSNDTDMSFHRHHIIPKHCGGKDRKNNYTYLSIREHYIAHWLLWKIHGNIKDLCASYLLQNKENKSIEVRKIWASMGGKIGGKKQKEFKIGIHDKEGILQKHWASMGGKSHKGKKAMYIPNTKTFKRVSPDKWNEYLLKGFIFGSPIKSQLGKKHGPSSRRKKVSDGITVYESVHAAAAAYGISPSAIIHRIKKSPKSTWTYI